MDFSNGVFVYRGGSRSIGSGSDQGKVFGVFTSLDAAQVFADLKHRVPVDSWTKRDARDPLNVIEETETEWRTQRGRSDRHIAFVKLNKEYEE